jgi:hypothetical protein
MKVQYGFDKVKYRTDEDVEAQLGASWKKKVFEIVFTNTISQVHPNGLKGPGARSCNRILDALDQSEDDFFELSVADAEFLKSIFNHENAAVMPGQARPFCLIQDAVEAAFKVEA